MIKMTEPMLVNLVLTARKRGEEEGRAMSRTDFEQKYSELARIESERTQALVEKLNKVRAGFAEGGKSDRWVSDALASLDPRPAPSDDPNNAERYPTMFKEKI